MRCPATGLLHEDGGGCFSLCYPPHHCPPVTVSLQPPKISGNRTRSPATCQSLMRKGLLEWEFHIKMKCALKETHTILYFCEMILIILHVYFAQFSGIQGKVFLGFGMLQRRQYCTEHSIVIFSFFFLESCTDLKCNLYGFCIPFSLKNFELKIMTS